ncbi:hypothetical protein IHE45_16G069500 [Dioscorea alata]|uniref:Uncharacterized protein n=1 Tax=Dioscorea alata TaxID=55571 RepID=A0ACB7UIA4_DIOAL|nr:hypothetical protein IHE45_16G069500 [Dioscorea alata]
MLYLIILIFNSCVLKYWPIIIKNVCLIFNRVVGGCECLHILSRSITKLCKLRWLWRTPLSCWRTPLSFWRTPFSCVGLEKANNLVLLLSMRNSKRQPPKRDEQACQSFWFLANFSVATEKLLLHFLCLMPIIAEPA